MMSFFKQILPVYSILALLRRSSIYFLIACCCRLFSMFGFISSSDGTFRSRVSSSLMMCQPYWVCTGANPIRLAHHQTGRHTRSESTVTGRDETEHRKQPATAGNQEIY